MDIFDRARRALGDLAQSASTQAQIIQLQTRLGQTETELERQYAEAGRKARELWRRRLILDGDFEILMTRITALHKEQERLRAEMTTASAGPPSGAPPPATPPPPPG
jgi:uncharacterized small protein (DUF1192 family)